MIHVRAPKALNRMETPKIGISNCMLRTPNLRSSALERPIQNKEKDMCMLGPIAANVCRLDVMHGGNRHRLLHKCQASRDATHIGR